MNKFHKEQRQCRMHFQTISSGKVIEMNWRQNSENGVQSVT
jgi:hypothetical protein